MKTLIVGASGFIGRHLQRALLDGGHPVVPLSRRHGVDVGRLTQAAAWRPFVDGVDAVVNAVGIIGETRMQSFRRLHTDAPVALFEACAEAGVPRVVQISALGADAQAFSAYHRSKRAADDALRALDLEGFVLRPALIHGPGGASAAVFARLARLPLIPVIGDGGQAIQPVHVSDVVDAIVRCLTTAATRRTLDIVGPQTFSFAQWLQHLRAAQGLPPARLLHLPDALVRAAAFAGQGLSPMLRDENLRMLKAGVVGDSRAFTAFMGRAPRAATPGLIAQDLQPAGSIA